ncbi:hypothetical protein ACWEKM_08975 [Streptomyces sp. NPDC004752]
MWLRLVSAPENKTSGKSWDGALDAQHAFGDLDGHRPVLLAVHDAVDDTTAYRAELSVRVDERVLSDDPILQHELPLPDSWWNDLAGTLEKVSAVRTDRVAVRQQYMERAVPEFVGIPAPAVSCWTTAHADVHWAKLTSPLCLPGWEGWRQAPEGFDAATLYAYSLLQPDTAARVRDAFPVLGSPAGLAAERPCALSCSRPWPAATTWSSKTSSGTGLRNSAAADQAPCPHAAVASLPDARGATADDAGTMRATATWSGTIAFGMVSILIQNRIDPSD